MNRYIRRLEKYGIWCDNTMTEIRGVNGGTYGVQGYRVIGYNTKNGLKTFNDRIWVRYDGSIWPQGSISDLIKYHGFKDN